jgi:hypothetical protein
MLAILTVMALLPTSATVDNVRLRPARFQPSVQVWEKDVPSQIPWDEAVVSWSVDRAENAALRIEAIVRQNGQTSKAYVLADWALDPELGERRSWNGQGDEIADVQTDTLVLSKAGGQLSLRVTMRARPEAPLPRWKGLWVSFSTNHELHEASPNRRAWGKVIEAPRRAQMNYPNGSVICSPTAVSMAIGHWANVLGKSELDRDVPEVVANVYDPEWNGTGNWPFNTAYAGSLPGLVGKTLRLRSLRDLEDLIVAGVPPIASVSYALLKGKPEPEPGDGHLVMLVGFEKNGDPIFNDPGRSIVRLTYGRKAFERAWLKSRRTVYIIAPERKKLPLPLRAL